MGRCRSSFGRRFSADGYLVDSAEVDPGRMLDGGDDRLFGRSSGTLAAFVGATAGRGGAGAGRELCPDYLEVERGEVDLTNQTKKKC